MRENVLLPPLSAHLQLDAHGSIINWQEVLRLSQIRFILGSMEVLRASVDAYSKAIDQCQEIIRAIDEELQKG